MNKVSGQELIDLKFQLEKELCERSYKEFLRRAWVSYDTSELVWNWHMDIMCDLLQWTYENKINKLLITIPPSSSKTSICSIYFQAWLWIKNPKLAVLFSTYGQKLSDEVAEKTRNFVLSPWFQDRWGVGTPHNICINHEWTSKKSLFKNNHQGLRINTSVGGINTGLHADYIICDDLSKAQDAAGKFGILGDNIKKSVQYFTGTLITRQKNHSSTRWIVIGQRLHHEDIASYCIQESDWVHLNLPMEAVYDNRTIIYKHNRVISSCQGDDRLPPESKTLFEDVRVDGELLMPHRIDKKAVEALKTALGKVGAGAQLQQQPTPPGGAIVNVDDINIIDENNIKDIINKPGNWMITVDASFGGMLDDNSYNVCQMWKSVGTDYYLLDQHRFRGGVSDVIKSIIDLHTLNLVGVGLAGVSKNVIVEKKANGSAILEQFRRNIKSTSMLIFDEYEPKTDKVSRLQACVPVIEARRVWIRQAKWTDDYLKELEQFPYSKYNDQVDSTSCAIIKFLEKSTDFNTRQKLYANFFGRYL